jgi:hypothetical protein
MADSALFPHDPWAQGAAVHAGDVAPPGSDDAVAVVAAQGADYVQGYGESDSGANLYTSSTSGAAQPGGYAAAAAAAGPITLAQLQHVVHVRGLPWQCTAEDVVKFFEGCAIVPGGILMTFNAR